MFPANWAQTWLELPDANEKGQLNFPAMMQWWLVDPVPDPATWNPLFFAADFQVHLLTGPMFWVWSKNLLGGIVRFRTYINTPSMVLFGTEPFFPNVYDGGPVLPRTKCVVFRTFTGTLGRRHCGRKFLSPVPELYVTDAGVLNTVGYNLYSLSASYFATAFSSQGSTFTPVLVSYANGTATPITSSTVNMRLGNIKRRGRQTFTIPSYQPKPPPV